MSQKLNAAAVLFFGVLILSTCTAHSLGQFNGTLTKLISNMDQFRGCVDKYLANVVGDVNQDIGEPLKPVFDVVGDQISRLEKAWEALTKSKPTPDPDDE